MNNMVRESEDLIGKQDKYSEKKTSELGDLKKMLDDARKKFEEDVEQMKSNNQQGE